MCTTLMSVNKSISRLVANQSRKNEDKIRIMFVIFQFLPLDACPFGL